MALPKRLKDTATAAMLLGAAAMPFGQAAHAGDDVRLAANTTVEAANASNTLKVASAEKTSYTKREAWKESAGRIVLHYGENVKSVDLDAEALRRLGYPTIALSGAEPDVVTLFVGQSRPVDFNQDDLTSGALGSIALQLYERRVGPPKKPSVGLVAGLN